MSPVWFGDNPAPSSEWNHVPTTTAFVDLAPLIADATQIWIDDPLAFPWDTFGEPIHAPVTVNVGRSLLDLAALAPWLKTLGEGDRIVCDDPAVTKHLTTRFGTAGPETPLAERERVKSIERGFADAVARMTAQIHRRNETDRMRIETIPLEAIVSPTHGGSFAETVRDHLAAHGPGSVTEVWGIRDSPGAPLAGAVIAYRLDEESSDQ